MSVLSDTRSLSVVLRCVSMLLRWDSMAVLRVSVLLRIVSALLMPLGAAADIMLIVLGLVWGDVVAVELTIVSVCDAALGELDGFVDLAQPVLAAISRQAAATGKRE